MTDIKKVLPNTAMPVDWLLAKDGAITQEELNAAASKKHYQNRDEIPEPLLRFADLYHDLTTQEPTNRSKSDWIDTFESWKQEGLQEDDIRAAFAKSNDINGGFPVGRPGALTTTAVAMKTKNNAAPVVMKVNTKAIEGTKQMLDEKVKDMVFVPRPANVPRPVFKKKEG